MRLQDAMQSPQTDALGLVEVCQPIHGDLIPRRSASVGEARIRHGDAFEHHGFVSLSLPFESNHIRSGLSAVRYTQAVSISPPNGTW